MRFIFLAFPLALIVSSLALAAPATAPSVPPEPEQFVNDGLYTQYAQVAQDFLRAHPNSPAAPRIAMDLLITSATFDDQLSTYKMRKLLASDYPATPQGKFMIATMGNAQLFDDTMNDVLEDHFDDSNVLVFAGHYDQLLNLGYKRFGELALGSGATLVRNFTMLSIARDAQLLNVDWRLLQATSARGQPWMSIVVALTQPNQSLLERLQHLHSMPDRDATVPFERDILHGLKDADRANPAAMQIEAEDDLQAGDLAGALPLLTKLPPSARNLFWQAYATGLTGNPAAAGPLFAKLKHDYPSDPWTGLGEQVQPGFTSFDATLAKNVETALALSRAVKSGIELFEIRAKVSVPRLADTDLYCAYQAGSLFELDFIRADKPLMIYRASADGAFFFIQGSANAAHFAKPAPLPIPIFALQRTGADFRTVRGLRGFSYSFDEFQAALNNLTAGEAVSTRDGLQDLFRFYASRGIAPLPPAPSAAGGTVYTWVFPAVTEPTLTRASFTVSPTGVLTAIAAPTWSTTSLRYGPAGSFTFSPPATPAAKIVENSPMDMNFMQQLVPAAISFFEPPPPTTQPATQPSTK